MILPSLKLVTLLSLLDLNIICFLIIKSKRGDSQLKQQQHHTIIVYVTTSSNKLAPAEPAGQRADHRRGEDRQVQRRHLHQEVPARQVPRQGRLREVLRVYQPRD